MTKHILQKSKVDFRSPLQKDKVKEIEKGLSHNLNKKAFWCCLGLSAALLIASFFVPPLGVIDNSILVAVSELFAFSALGTVISAIRKGSDVTVTHGDTSIHIDNDEDQN